MSGLFAGLMLRAAGWQVDIYEKVEGQLSGRGAGIVAQPEILTALNALGLDTRELGVAVAKRRLFASSGQMVLETECPQVMTAWERVYRILHDAFPAQHYHQGWSLRAVDQFPDRVTAIFANGETVSADVLIGADGIRFWNKVLQAASEYFPLAYLWPATTAIYLLLRREIDGTELTEVVFDEGDAKRGLPNLTPDAATGVPQLDPAKQEASAANPDPQA